MLHRALFGSLERFVGILIENYAGKFPFWISPLQTMVIPISEEFNDYAVEVSKKIKNAGISSAVDLKNNNLNYKIRDHSLAKIPLLLICGKKEVDTNSVTIRRLDSNKQENMELKTFLKTFSALNKASKIKWQILNKIIFKEEQKIEVQDQTIGFHLQKFKLLQTMEKI